MELPEKIRAFVALAVPAEVIAGLAEVQSRLKRELRGVSWTRPEAIHLTLHFFGNIAGRDVDRIRAVLEGVAAQSQPFDLAVRGVGSFGGRVIWAGLEGECNRLNQLAVAVRSAVASFGEHEEDREFNAHITLGRARNRLVGLGATLRGFEGAAFGTWRVSAVELVRSELLPQGARYTVLAEAPLRT